MKDKEVIGKGIVEQLNDIDFTATNDYKDIKRQIVIHTGKKGAYVFHIECEITSSNIKELRDLYRKKAMDLYDYKTKYDRISSNKFIKLLIKLKIVKV